MKYTVRQSYIDVIGKIWMPATTCAMRYRLTGYDVENIKAHDEKGKITRDAIEQWLVLNSGDFQSITDFSGSIEDGDESITIAWKDDDSEMAYFDYNNTED